MDASPFYLQPAPKARVPHPSSFCEGWDVNCPHRNATELRNLGQKVPTLLILTNLLPPSPSPEHMIQEI